MAAPEWRKILEAQLAANPQNNVYALATAENGSPRVRHVVHREFTPTNLLLATTDQRMPKAAQIAATPQVEVAWYFPSPMVQVRVRGGAWTFPGRAPPPPTAPTAGTAPTSNRDQWEDMRTQMFGDISPYLRATFARPATPGSRLVDAPDGKTWPVKLGDDEGAADTLEFAEKNFAILVIEPHRVEVLNLKASPHERTEWVRQGSEWVKHEIVP